MMKLFGKVELLLGLALILLCSYFMLESALYPDRDRHGYLIMIAIFGASIGGLMSFAGVVCIAHSNYRRIAHLPLVIYTVIAIYTFEHAYA